MLGNISAANSVEASRFESLAKKRSSSFRNVSASKKEAVSEEKSSAGAFQYAPFVPAFIAAGLKDILDLVLLALKAAAGISVVLSPLIAVGIAVGTVITWCVSIFIGLMLILASQNGKRSSAKKIVSRLAKRGVVLGGFTIIESVPILAVAPLEIVMVLVLLLMMIKENKKSSK